MVGPYACNVYIKALHNIPQMTKEATREDVMLFLSEVATLFMRFRGDHNLGSYGYTISPDCKLSFHCPLCSSVDEDAAGRIQGVMEVARNCFSGKGEVFRSDYRARTLSSGTVVFQLTCEYSEV